MEKARKTLITSEDAQLFIENLAEDEDGEAIDLATAIVQTTFDQCVLGISDLFNQFLGETLKMYSKQNDGRADIQAVELLGEVTRYSVFQ